MSIKDDETDRRLNVAVGLVIAGAVAAIGWAAIHLTATGLSPWRLALTFATLVIAGRTIIYTRIGSDRHGMWPDDAAIVLALMLLPWPWFIIAVAVATALTKASLRDVQAIKVAF